MTNAEKYLKDGVDSRYFATALYKFILQGSNTSEENSILGYINTFLDLPVQPTLTEDERVILRNIDIKAFKTIGRRKSGGLYVRFIFQGETYNADIFNDNLFQFIKERRRI